MSGEIIMRFCSHYDYNILIKYCTLQSVARTFLPSQTLARHDNNPHF